MSAFHDKIAIVTGASGGIGQLRNDWFKKAPPSW
jgi:NADP-dependent 3-hydroxy acid dehydrogenase YdfG